MPHVHAMTDKNTIVRNSLKGRHQGRRIHSVGSIITTLLELGRKNKSYYLTIREIIPYYSWDNDTNNAKKNIQYFLLRTKYSVVFVFCFRSSTLHAGSRLGLPQSPIIIWYVIFMSYQTTYVRSESGEHGTSLKSTWHDVIWSVFSNSNSLYMLQLYDRTCSWIIVLLSHCPASKKAVQ